MNALAIIICLPIKALGNISTYPGIVYSVNQLAFACACCQGEPLHYNTGNRHYDSWKRQEFHLNPALALHAQSQSLTNGTCMTRNKVKGR